jgi:hypothetical protein
MKTQIILQNLMITVFLLVQLPNHSETIQQPAITEASLSHFISTKIEEYR